MSFKQTRHQNTFELTRSLEDSVLIDATASKNLDFSSIFNVVNYKNKDAFIFSSQEQR
jgi:hypothetical protein